MPLISTAANAFELLELPDGRWCVAKPAEPAAALVAGSFAQLSPAALPAGAPGEGPVGFYASRDAAERAIQRAAPAPGEGALAVLAALLALD